LSCRGIGGKRGDGRLRTLGLALSGYRWKEGVGKVGTLGLELSGYRWEEGDGRLGILGFELSGYRWEEGGRRGGEGEEEKSHNPNLKAGEQKPDHLHWVTHRGGQGPLG